MRCAAFRSAVPLLLLASPFLAVALSAGELPIRVQEGAMPEVFWPAPVKCGVPFPEGALRPGDPVALVDGAGKPQVLQSAVTATWDPKSQKGVRWLLIDFLAARDTSYRLVFGADTPAAAPAATPIARVENGTIVVEAELLRGRCGAHRFDLLGALEVNGGFLAGWRRTTKDGEWAGPYIEHEKRGLFRADLDAEAACVLEETGPIRATIRAEGWYANEAGEKFCRFIVRVHVFRNQRNVRVEHTFIFTGNSREDRLTDIGIRLPLDREKSAHSYTMFGSVNETGLPTPISGGSRSDVHVYQVMDSPDRLRYEWILADGATGAVRLCGAKAAGLVRGNTDKTSLCAVIRDAWQQYPFELEWKAGDVYLHLWPKHGRVWDTSWDGQWHFLTEQQKRYMARSKPKMTDENFEKNLERLRNANAYGQAKTHEVWLFFGADSHWKSAPMYHEAVHRPAYAHADLRRQCESRALDWMPHHPFDPVNFPDEEAYLATILDIVERHVERQRIYGWWDWGGYHQFFEDTEPLMRYGDLTLANTGGQASWHRARPKSHYQWGSFPWMMYLRTGEARWLRYAQTFTLYSADRGMIHDGKWAGADLPYDNTEVHWIGGWQGAYGGLIHTHNLMDKNDYIYQFWLTGDRRPLDALKEWARLFPSAHSLKEPYYDPKQAFTGNNIRNTGGRLRRLMTWYEATWDEDFRRYCREMIDIFPGAAVREEAAKATWFTTWMHEGLFRAWKVFGDDNIRQSALAYCRNQADVGAGMFAGGIESGVLDWCAYGHALTGEELYLDLGRRIVDRSIAEWATRHSLQAGGRKLTVVTLPRFLGAMFHAPEAWRAANLPTHRNGISLDFHFYDRYKPQDKARPVYLLQKKDGEFTVRFTATETSARFAVLDPDGKEAAREPDDPPASACRSLTLPADGKAGVYLLRCVAIDEKALRPGERPRLCMLPTASDGLVYPAMTAPGAGLGFAARAWFVGLPARTEGAALTYTHRHGIFCADIPFVVTRADGAWRLSSADLAWRHYGGFDTFRYTFPLPSSDKPEVFRCGLAYRPHAAAHSPDGAAPGGYAVEEAFSVRTAPPFVSASPDAWFDPGPHTAP